jgi:hypothetical protein
LGFRARGSGFRIQDSGFEVKGLGSHATPHAPRPACTFPRLGPGFRINELGFRVTGLGLRLTGYGLQVTLVPLLRLPTGKVSKSDPLCRIRIGCPLRVRAGEFRTNRTTRARDSRLPEAGDSDVIRRFRINALAVA